MKGRLLSRMEANNSKNTPPVVGAGSVSNVGNAIQTAVDHLLSDYVQELHAKLNALEEDFRNAWSSLDFLSLEYVRMWERLESVETLLYEQQVTISRLVEMYSQNGRTIPADILQLASTNASEKIAAASAIVAIPVSTGITSADEAFYRSLNSAHRDSPSLFSESDNELRMIWESAQSPLSHNRPGSAAGRKSSGSGNANNSADNIFSSQDYFQYRRTSPLARNHTPEEINETSETPWMKWKTVDSSSNSNSTPIKEIEKANQKLRRESDRLQQLRERLGHAAITAPPVPPVPPTLQNVSKDRESDILESELLEQLRLAFIESARSKLNPIETDAKASSTSSVIYPSIYSPNSIVNSSIDPLHLGRSNSPENISPNFSSYLRMPENAAAAATAAVASHPPSPNKKLPSRSSTPLPSNQQQIAAAAGAASTTIPKSPLRIVTTPSEDSTTSGGSKLTPRSPRTLRRNQSPSRLRSDSGISSSLSSGNWSSLEKSPSSPNPKSNQSSSKLFTNHADLYGYAENDKYPSLSRRKDLQTAVATPGRQGSVFPGTSQKLMASSDPGSILTTETWNVQGSICSVVTSTVVTWSTAPVTYSTASSNRRFESQSDALQDASNIEFNDMNEYFSNSGPTIDDNWFNRGVVRSSGKQRSNTPSPAPGSLPEFVPAPANIFRGSIDTGKGSSQTSPFCRPSSSYFSYPDDPIGMGQPEVRTSPKLVHRLHASPTPGVSSTSPTPQQRAPNSADYANYLSAPTNQAVRNRTPELNEDYTAHRPVSESPNYYYYTNVAGTSPLRNAELRPQEQSYDHRYVTQEGAPDVPRSYPYHSPVIVSQCGYISIASTPTSRNKLPSSPNHRMSPRKKIRHTMNQMMPNFGRHLKKRSYSLPGVDAMDRLEESPGTGLIGRKPFSRTASLPSGLKKSGTKFISKLSNMMGGSKSRGKNLPGSLQSLPTEDGPEWVLSSGLQGHNPGGHSFVSYCNEGFDLGNDWDSVVTGDTQSPSSTPTTLSRMPTTTSTTNEFAASRALGRYRSRQASLTPASAEPPPPDVTIVSSKTPEGSPRNTTPITPPASPLPVPPVSPQPQSMFPKVSLKITHQDGCEEESPEPLSDRYPPGEPIPNEGAHEQRRQSSVNFFSSSLQVSVTSEGTSRSASRQSSRWQSTEDSIDTDDEWYRYGMMQLEEEERQSEATVSADLAAAALEYNKNIVGHQMQVVLEELKAKVTVIESTCDSGDVDYWPPSETPSLERGDEEEERWTTTTPSVDGDEITHHLRVDADYSSDTSGPDSDRESEPTFYADSPAADIRHRRHPHDPDSYERENYLSERDVYLDEQEPYHEEEYYASNEANSGLDHESYDRDYDDRKTYTDEIRMHTEVQESHLGGQESHLEDQESRLQVQEFHSDAGEVDQYIPNQEFYPAETSSEINTSGPEILSEPEGIAYPQEGGFYPPDEVYGAPKFVPPPLERKASESFLPPSNLLSAAGSTVSNITSSLFSMFSTSTSSPNKEESVSQTAVPLPEIGAVTAVCIPAASSAEMTENPKDAETTNQSATDTTGVAAPPDGTPTTTTSGGLNRKAGGGTAKWKLVKTLRDKKAETNAAASPTNEAVRMIDFFISIICTLCVTVELRPTIEQADVYLKPSNNIVVKHFPSERLISSTP